MYDSKVARWFVQDPLSEKYYAHSPYNYCVNNPVMFVDPDGMRTWPINEVYKNYKRRHENNFNSQRDNGKRYHKGIDINYEAAGDNDLGAPIFATHDGIITRVVHIDTGDKDSGGNRVKIESVNGEVSTYYMHLDEIFTDIQVGESVIEGQQIGTMGGSGNGKKKKYAIHLHYEIAIDGKNVNPANDEFSLIDPQCIIYGFDGGVLPPVIITEKKPQLPPLPIVKVELVK